MTNESVNLYNTRGGKLLFIPQVNTTHYGIKFLRYNGPVFFWNTDHSNIVWSWYNGPDFFSNTDHSNNICNTGVSKFKHYLKDLLVSQYKIG